MNIYLRENGVSDSNLVPLLEMEVEEERSSRIQRQSQMLYKKKPAMKIFRQTRTLFFNRYILAICVNPVHSASKHI